jgi:hypothetical protein
MEIKTLTVSAETHRKLFEYAAKRNISMAKAIRDLLFVEKDSAPAVPGSGRAELEERIKDLKEAGSRAKKALMSAMEEQDNNGLKLALKILEENFV